MDLILGGECIVTDDPPRPKIKMPAAALTRAQFDTLPLGEKRDAARTKQIVDADPEGMLL